MKDGVRDSAQSGFGVIRRMIPVLNGGPGALMLSTSLTCLTLCTCARPTPPHETTPEPGHGQAVNAIKVRLGATSKFQFRSGPDGFGIGARSERGDGYYLAFTGKTVPLLQSRAYLLNNRVSGLQIMGAPSADLLYIPLLNNYQLLDHASGDEIAHGRVGGGGDPCGGMGWLRSPTEVLIATNGFSGRSSATRNTGALRVFDLLSKEEQVLLPETPGTRRCLGDLTATEDGWLVVWTEDNRNYAQSRDGKSPEVASGDFVLHLGTLQTSVDGPHVLEPQQSVRADDLQYRHGRLRVVKHNNGLDLLYQGPGNAIYHVPISASGFGTESQLLPPRSGVHKWDACSLDENAVVFRSSPKHRVPEHSLEILDTEGIPGLRVVDSSAEGFICTDAFAALAYMSGDEVTLVQVDLDGAGAVRITPATDQAREFAEFSPEKTLADSCKEFVGERKTDLVNWAAQPPGVDYPVSGASGDSLRAAACEAGCIALCLDKARANPTQLGNLPAQCKRGDDSACSELLEKAGYTSPGLLDRCLTLGGTACANDGRFFVGSLTNYLTSQVACLTGIGEACDVLTSSWKSREPTEESCLFRHQTCEPLFKMLHERGQIERAVRIGFRNCNKQESLYVCELHDDAFADLGARDAYHDALGELCDKDPASFSCYAFATVRKRLGDTQTWRNKLHRLCDLSRERHGAEACVDLGMDAMQAGDVKSAKSYLGDACNRPDKAATRCDVLRKVEQLQNAKALFAEVNCAEDGTKEWFDTVGLVARINCSGGRRDGTAWFERARNPVFPFGTTRVEYKRGIVEGSSRRPYRGGKIEGVVDGEHTRVSYRDGLLYGGRGKTYVTTYDEGVVEAGGGSRVLTCGTASYLAAALDDLVTNVEVSCSWPYRGDEVVGRDGTVHRRRIGSESDYVVQRLVEGVVILETLCQGGAPISVKTYGPNEDGDAHTLQRINVEWRRGRPHGKARFYFDGELKEAGVVVDGVLRTFEPFAAEVSCGSRRFLGPSGYGPDELAGLLQS